jgi:phosphoglycolate phosphatase
MFTHLLLDFDGTLADSSPGIYHSFCLACADLGLTAPSLTDFRYLIGPPIQHIALRLFPQLAPDALEQFRLIFRKDYDQQTYRLATWYPDVLATLNALANYDNMRMSIVTNKPTLPTVELVKAADLLGCFDRVVGIDYLALHGGESVFSSKTEALRYTLASASFRPEHSIYIGDSPSDQMASSNCSATFVAALYGFHVWNNGQRLPWSLERFSQIESLLADITR